jgi:sulfatase maturation enzyme AslB (radical SAM superfamily)
MLKEIVERGGCSIPWLHTEINLQTNQVKPCCKYADTVGTTTEKFVDVWSNKKYQQLRQDIETNTPHPNCSACDVTTGFSYKQFKNSAYQSMLEVKENDLPKIFHFTLKNTCNLACRMCHPTVSSKLAEVSKRSEYLNNFYKTKIVDNKFDLKKLAGSFVNARDITIGGGEPLIDEDCIDLIKMVADESNSLKRVVFSTNMMRFNQRLIDLLSTLSISVQFNISIDGPPHIHDYIRYGSQWEQIVKNLKFLRKNYKFGYGINTTISALNVGYIPETLDALTDIEYRIGIKFSHVMASPVLENHLHAGVLPNSVKELYRTKLLACNKRPDLIKTGLDLLECNKQQHWLQFVEFINEFDAVAGTDLVTVYSEIKSSLPVQMT